MKNKYVLLLIGLFLIVIIGFSTNVSATENCWEYSTETTCVNDNRCSWDAWGNSCYEKGCWDYSDNQTACEAQNGTMGCSWSTASGDNWGWCEESGACWNYENETSCLNGGCLWDSTWNGCYKPGCWDYQDQANCTSVTSCAWEDTGWCSETGCWNYLTKDSCEAESGSGCAWDSQWSYCYKKSCWDYGTQAECTAQAECEWDSSGSYCKEPGCWDYWNQSACSAAAEYDCSWESYSMCTKQGCWDGSYTNRTYCESLGDCTWSNPYCNELSCWDYNQTTCQLDSSCEWEGSGGSCNELSCWDYSSQSACEADSSNYSSPGRSCAWDSNWNYCYEQSCWNYNTSLTCGADNSCEWNDWSYCSEPSCWDYSDNETYCLNSTFGMSCAWDSSGSYCYTDGCWNYNSTNCNSQPKCEWNSNWNYCSEKSCWDYSNATDCNNDDLGLGRCEWSGSYCYENGCWNFDDNSTYCSANECQWNEYSYCSEKSCWDYTTQSNCESDSQNLGRNCAWSSDYNYCYEQGCWNYNNQTSCDSSELGCQWDSTYNYCYEQNCWSFDDSSSCNSADITGKQCEWDSWGWCSTVGCWDYSDQTNCTAQASTLGCAWDSNWNYCYEQSCWDYSSQSACESFNDTKNCVWDVNGNYCYEKGCWNIYDESSCTSSPLGCTWDNSYGWCGEQGCWNWENNNTCLRDPDCQWDSTYNYCYEKGCWDNNDQSSCTSNSKCEWSSSGWCYEEGCWDNPDQSSCESAVGCQWDSTYNYCYEKGCWENWNQTACDASAQDCEWKTGSSWGWCEEFGCWNYDSWHGGNQTACENSGMSCIWVDDPWLTGSEGWCNSADSCWAYDYTNQSLCESSGLGCEWNDPWCNINQTSGGCHSYDNDKQGCMDTFYCWWDPGASTCEPPTDGIVIEFTENPSCWIFNAEPSACGNVTFCSYNSSTSTCDPIMGLEDANIQCGNITGQDLCNNIPVLNSCCEWRIGSNCTADTYSTACWDDIQPPPEGATNCGDYNAINSEETCNKISGDPWYMPCTWSDVDEECQFDFGSVVGGGGNINDIKTKKTCEAAGGTWVNEEYCDDMGTPSNTSDDVLKVDGWCIESSGGSSSSCDSSCWACETQTSSGDPVNSSNARSACESSAQDCEWEDNANAPNGLGGYCNFAASTIVAGDCDSNCASCLTQTNCESSQTDCEWFSDPSNPSDGYCDDESARSCSEDCFSCEDSVDCINYGLGGNSKCVWDSSNNICKPDKFNKEICNNEIDDDNNGQIDCDDPWCTFSESCGGGSFSECWKYDNNQTRCNAQADCAWIQDNWGGSWCGYAGEQCWEYDDNQTACEDQTGICRWRTEENGGWCGINSTKEQDCFKYQTKNACTASYCTWKPDPSSAKGGTCDYKLFECEWNSTRQESKSKCEQRTTTGEKICRWVLDPDMSTGGKCEPTCYSANNATCSSNSYCQWISGWCEADIVHPEDCWEYDDNQTACEDQIACAYVSGFFGSAGNGMCDVTVNKSIDCSEYEQNDTCLSYPDNCIWLEDPWNPGWGFCEFKEYSCFQYMDNQTGCEADPGCIWQAFSGASAGGGFSSGYSVLQGQTIQSAGFCDVKCMNMSLQTESACGAVSGCEWIGGLCEPANVLDTFGGMIEGGPPVEVARDDCPENGLDSVSDICFIGVKDMSESFGIGTGVADIADSIICNGQSVQGEGGSLLTGDGTKTAKFYWYLDTDGNRNGGCATGDSAETGYEFFIKYEGRQTDAGIAEKKAIYKCDEVNAEWNIMDVTPSVWRSKMCLDLQGGMAAISKADLMKFSDLYNPNEDVRIYAETANKSTDQTTPIDTASGWFDASAVDFKFEDCSGFEDADGDGLLPDQDPDCKFAKQYGFVMKEDCFSVADDDGDGYVNCEDSDCKWTPECGGDYTFTADVNDTSAPTVNLLEVNTFPDSAFIVYDTDEPSNGTILFYNTSSTCTGNYTLIRDIGIIDSNVPAYKSWHDGPIDNYAGNSEALSSALLANTTYYYKTKNCDPSGNCGTSSCLSFTTEASQAACGSKCNPTFEFTYQENSSDTYRDDVNFYYDWGSGYEQQGGVCGSGGIRKNYTETSNFSMQIVPGGASVSGIQDASVSTVAADNWGMVFQEMKAKGTIDASRTNLNTSDILAGSNGSVEYIGMDHDKYLELKSQFRMSYIELRIPGNSTILMHCDDDLTNCEDITSTAVSRNYYSSGDYTVWKIPATEGAFSTYYGTVEDSSESSSPGGSSPGGGGGSTGGAIGGGAGTTESDTTDDTKDDITSDALDTGTSLTGLKTGELVAPVEAVGGTLEDVGKAIKSTPKMIWAVIGAFMIIIIAGFIYRRGHLDNHISSVKSSWQNRRKHSYSGRRSLSDYGFRIKKK